MKLKTIPQFLLFKNCITCKKEKLTSEFNKQKTAPDGLQNQCRECVSTKRKDKWKNDPNYRSKMTISVMKWYEENKEIVLERNKIYSKDYNSKPWARIPQGLQKRLAEKTKFRSRIGMKTPDLKIYLESLFIDGMTWENYGKTWQIRLIRPINDFDLNDSGEVSKINHYTNLKPSFSPEFLKSQGILKNA